MDTSPIQKQAWQKMSVGAAGDGHAVLLRACTVQGLCYAGTVRGYYLSRLHECLQARFEARVQSGIHLHLFIVSKRCPRQHELEESVVVTHMIPVRLWPPG